MKLKETMKSEILPSEVITSWASYLKTDGKRWSDAPGGRNIVKSSYQGIDGYGLLDHNDNVICIATFQPIIVQNQNFYQLQIVTNTTGSGGKFFPILNLLWTIKEYIGLPIIDYGSQTDKGRRLAQALGTTQRFKMYWFNIKTGEKQQYDPKIDSEDNKPFRGTFMTPWRIVVENEKFSSFPLNEKEYHILSSAVSCELFKYD